MSEPLPQSAYLGRAANRERPAEWTDDFFATHLGHDADVLHRAAVAAAAATAGVHTFGCDISKYQAVVDSTYPLPWLICRIDTGRMIDEHAAANAAQIARMPSIRLHEWYPVHIPGEESAQLNRIKNFFGKGGPPAGTRFMIDEEAGAGFAGRGNHTAEVVWLANELNDLVGSDKGTRTYANQGDYASNLPGLPGWLDERAAVAAYSSTPPARHWYTWQYAGGDPRWSSPTGYPRSVKPFGSYVDFNVCNRSIDQMLVDFGITTTDPLMEEIMAFYSSKADFQADLARIVGDELKASRELDRAELGHAVVVMRSGKPVGWFNKDNIPGAFDGAKAEAPEAGA